MAFCGYCGSQMPDDLMFCTECGKPLMKKRVSDGSGSETSNNMDSNPHINRQEYVQNVSPQYNTQNELPPGQDSDMNQIDSNINPNMGFQKASFQSTPLDKSVVDEKSPFFERFRWPIFIVIIVACYIDYYSDPPVFTIILSLGIIAAIICHLYNNPKFMIINGIGIAFAIWCLAMGLRQGSRIGWFVDPTPQDYINAGYVVDNNTSNNNSSNSGSSHASTSSSGNNSSTGSNSSSGKVDPDLKAFLDSYEDFMDDYVAFMKKYSSDPQNAVSMMNDYMNMLARYQDFAMKADQYNPDTMSAADSAYYIEVMARIDKKLLSAM